MFSTVKAQDLRNFQQPSLLATRACSRRNTFKQISYERKTLLVWFNGRFVEYR